MKILYDDQVFSMMTHSGMPRYYYELMKNLNEIGVDTELPLFFSNNYYLKNKDVSNHFSSLPFNLKVLNRTLPRFNRFCSKRALIKQNYDVFHPTYNDLPYFEDYLKGKPFVITIHHLQTLSPNNLFAPGEEELAMKASHIIAISNATKNDILCYTSVSEDKITVIHHGNSLLPSSFPHKKNKQSKPYFLYVGGRHAGKNFQFLLKALKVISTKYDVMLLCTGSPLSPSEMEMITAMNLSGRVKGFVVKDDSEMCQLYSNALCFIYPSLKEGFGLPILESFACKCPVLLSNASCFPEIAGDAGLYFDPYDLDSLIDSMVKILSSNSLRDELINKGMERGKLFSWRKTAEKTLMVYESVL